MADPIQPSCPFTFEVKMIPEPHIDAAPCLRGRCVMFIPVGSSESGEPLGMCAIPAIGRIVVAQAHREAAKTTDAEAARDANQTTN